ncbi:spermidine synthase [Sphingomonas vulcanisoli]|uniref:Spermidine synthase n=1 Tax=Sphingomonas vulcanisoli TaxID=1658060 RepID=A0ABX0TRH9_9SPHN|nr:spermidine synthase [Sphingomonas vulcanisoli]NIJ08132.1 spermidine synthase [Sphingomonas vulcanisoli]
MGSWESRSEEALATLVCRRLDGPASRILIGGLGMGFTLRAALDALPAGAEIVVAELVPKVVSWAKGTLAHVFGQSLSDPRVAVEIRDVHDLIVEQIGGFDAILLDVDNGPDGFTNAANERLYSNWGLRAARAALRPGGILAIWSAYPDDAFRSRVRDIGFSVEEIRIPIDRDRSDYDHVIWLAKRPA